MSPLSPLSPAANCHHLDAKPRGLTSLTTICRDGEREGARMSENAGETRRNHHHDGDRARENGRVERGARAIGAKRRNVR